MQELIDYIENGGRDKAELLRLYASFSLKTNITVSMLTKQKVRDTHILYQVWKVLPTDLKEKYNQKLEIAGATEEVRKVAEKVEAKINPIKVEEIIAPEKKKHKQTKAEMKSED